MNKSKGHMSIRCHSEMLLKITLLWEQQIHNRLGYFPEGFRETCRGHFKSYLTDIEKELDNDLCAVRNTISILKQTDTDSTCADTAEPAAADGTFGEDDGEDSSKT